jgi:hypothetical protein
MGVGSRSRVSFPLHRVTRLPQHPAPQERKPAQQGLAARDRHVMSLPTRRSSPMSPMLAPSVVPLRTGPAAPRIALSHAKRTGGVAPVAQRIMTIDARPVGVNGRRVELPAHPATEPLLRGAQEAIRSVVGGYGGHAPQRARLGPGRADQSATPIPKSTTGWRPQLFVTADTASEPVRRKSRPKRAPNAPTSRSRSRQAATSKSPDLPQMAAVGGWRGWQTGSIQPPPGQLTEPEPEEGVQRSRGRELNRMPHLSTLIQSDRAVEQDLPMVSSHLRSATPDGVADAGLNSTLAMVRQAGKESVSAMASALSGTEPVVGIEVEALRAAEARQAVIIGESCPTLSVLDFYPWVTEAIQWYVCLTGACVCVGESRWRWNIHCKRHGLSDQIVRPPLQHRLFTPESCTWTPLCIYMGRPGTCGVSYGEGGTPFGTGCVHP